jgi:hypothetical protein
VPATTTLLITPQLVDTTSVKYQVSMAPCHRNLHGTASVFEDARGNAFGTFLMGRDRSRQGARCVRVLVRAAQGFPRGICNFAT